MVMEIKDIFPTPIGFALNEDYSAIEHKHLINLDYHYHDQYDMTITSEKFVLNTQPISQIKNFIETQLKEYGIKTLGTDQPLRFTQSWCTKHDGILQKTFPHVHQNSIVSGAYYVSADQTTEGITFYKNTDYTDRFITWQTNPDLMKDYYWNWRWCKFPVRTGLLILFPSQLKHAVDGVATANNLRCSLAFNTWFEGNIGNQHDLSML
jgi:hypothetical protein